MAKKEAIIFRIIQKISQTLNSFLTLMGKFPEYSLDHIIGKLIQQKFMTTYSEFFKIEL